MANAVTYSDPDTFGRFVGVRVELGAADLGLGLSIVRECMNAMGGAVTVESCEHEGTTFILTWPPKAWRSA